MGITITSGVTDGEGAGVRAAPPPRKAKCKKWAPLLACISVINILLIFSKFLFLAFSKISRSVFGYWYRRVQLFA